MTEWKEISNGRLCLRIRDGLLIVKPRDAPDPAPLFCAVCGSANVDPDDAITHREFGCCRLCSLLWVDRDREAWIAGWRPSRADVEAELSRRRRRRRA